MTINFWHDYEHKEDTYFFSAASSKLFDYYVKKYPEINFQKKKYMNPDVVFGKNWYECYDMFIDNDPTRVKFLDNQCSYQTTIIENEETGKFIVYSFWDKASVHYLQFAPDIENIQQFLPACGTHYSDVTYNETDYLYCRGMQYKIIDEIINYTPISRGPFFLQDQIVNEIYDDRHKDRSVLDKPYFRGGVYGLRAYLLGLNKDIPMDERFDIRGETIPLRDFLIEMNKSAINIDLDCVAGVSSRTVDAMGLGTALIRTAPKVRYYKPLIPNYHYAEVKCNNLADVKTLADAFIDTYEYVKKDKDYIQYLSQNAKKYYEENNTLKAHVEILTKVINFESLLK